MNFVTQLSREAVSNTLLKQAEPGGQDAENNPRKTDAEQQGGRQAPAEAAMLQARSGTHKGGPEAKRPSHNAEQKN